MKDNNYQKVLKHNIIARLSSKPHKNKNHPLQGRKDTTLGPIKQPNEVSTIY